MAAAIFEIRDVADASYDEYLVVDSPCWVTWVGAGGTPPADLLALLEADEELARDAAELSVTVEQLLRDPDDDYPNRRVNLLASVAEMHRTFWRLDDARAAAPHAPLLDGFMFE